MFRVRRLSSHIAFAKRNVGGGGEDMGEWGAVKRGENGKIFPTLDKCIFFPLSYEEFWKDYELEQKNRGKRESRKLTQNKGVNLINPASVSKKKSGSDDSR